MAGVVISLENPVLQTLLFYVSILVLKMMFMAILTVFHRMKNKVFCNPEDAKMFSGGVDVNEDVERVRRAHLNDLENITLFFVISWVYILTNPNGFIAENLFRGFTLVRLIHTFVYAIFVIPQPVRAICWLVGYLIIGFMAFASAINFFRP